MYIRTYIYKECSTLNCRCGSISRVCRRRTSIVLSRLHYTPMLFSLKSFCLDTGAFVSHAAVRVRLSLKPRDHVTPRWLLIAARIDYRLCLFVHKTLLTWRHTAVHRGHTDARCHSGTILSACVVERWLLVPSTSRKIGVRHLPTSVIFVRKVLFYM